MSEAAEREIKSDIIPGNARRRRALRVVRAVI
jgi:hypothetical protein